MSIDKCCVSGFDWNGTPTGAEGELMGLKTYVTGSNKDRAILVIHDLFGWKFNNLRLLADHYAKEVNATAYLPDFFDGDIPPTQELLKPPTEWTFDLPGWTSRNGKEVGGPRILAVAQALRTSFAKVGAIGFCYGGWAVFQLGAKQHNPGKSGQQNLVDCISTAHPSWLTKEEVANVNVPVQIMAPEFDRAFTAEFRSYGTETIPKLGLPYDLQYFPGVEHAFATRGDENGPERRSMLRAKRAAVNWFREWLD